MNASPNPKNNRDKKFTLVSLGCPKNRVDSERILYAMAKHGFVFTNDASKTDIVIINTCAFIQTAIEESIAVIMELRAEAPRSRLVVAGCLPLRFRDDLAKALSEADLFVTPSQIPHLPAMLGEDRQTTIKSARRKKKTQSSVINTTLRLSSFQEAQESRVPGAAREDSPGRVITTPGYAYLKIADGCNRLCRYCTIPKIRGRFRSEPLDALVEESRCLAEMGVKEIILVAQDTVRYGRDISMKNGLLSLVQAIAEIRGIQWMRLMYLHPHGIPSNLPQLVNECDKLLPYLDIPFQHVAEKVLRAMGRPWKPDYIRKLVDSLRAKIPGLVLRTTFMVGFPGEGETEFQALRDFAELYSIEHFGVFEYSPEEDTKSLALGDPVPLAVKKQRADELRTLHLASAAKRNRARVGNTEKALVHGVSYETNYLLEARLWDQAPEVDGILYITDGVAGQGEIHDVLITDAYETDFFGAIQSR